MSLDTMGAGAEIADRDGAAFVGVASIRGLMSAYLTSYASNDWQPGPRHVKLIVWALSRLLASCIGKSLTWLLGGRAGNTWLGPLR